jgi:hypothetical protein
MVHQRRTQMQLSLFQTNMRIQSAIGSDLIELVKGEGYLYFVVDDKAHIYDTYSVYVPYLNRLPLARWIEEAQGFWDTMTTLHPELKDK